MRESHDQIALCAYAKSHVLQTAAQLAGYRDKLLALPQFLTKQRSAPVTNADVHLGFALTGHFLEKRVLLPRGETLPQSRARLLAHLAA